MNMKKMPDARAYSNQEVKQALLNTLVYFDSICEKYGLRYSLAYGTLIGAARHSGFIPWDDDIDVMMPQQDYLRLLELPEFKNQNGSEHFVLSSFSAEKNLGRSYFYPFAKLEDNTTACFFFRTKDEGGAFVDVFPVTGVPADEQARKDLIADVKKLRRNLSIANRRDADMKMNLKQMLKGVRRRFYHLNYRKYVKEILDRIFSYDYNESDRVAITVSSTAQREFFPHKMFEEYVRLPFEGREFWCVKDYDAMLRQTYGDWRKLPPEKDRVAQHEFVLYRKEDLKN